MSPPPGGPDHTEGQEAGRGGTWAGDCHSRGSSLPSTVLDAAAGMDRVEGGAVQARVEPGSRRVILAGARTPSLPHALPKGPGALGGGPCGGRALRRRELLRWAPQSPGRWRMGAHCPGEAVSPAGLGATPSGHARAWHRLFLLLLETSPVSPEETGSQEMGWAQAGKPARASPSNAKWGRRPGPLRP